MAKSAPISYFQLEDAIYGASDPIGGTATEEETAP